MVIPAVAIAFVLLIVPLSHGGPPLPQLTRPTEQDAAVRTAVGILRAEAGKGTTRVGASPSAAPLLDFYRARYRQRNWLPGSAEADYFLWVQPDSAARAASRQILFQQGGVVLAR